MSRVLKRLAGSGTAGAFASGDKFKLTTGFVPLKDDLDVLLLAALQRNVFAGGGHGVEIDASAAGTFDLPGWLPIEVDNSSNQLTGFTDANGATLVVQFRFLVWVSNAAITVTPKVYDITAAAAATTSGAAACSATSEDYSGTDQQQTLALTLPNAKHKFRPQLVVGGTPAAGYRARGLCLFDCYVSS